MEKRKTLAPLGPSFRATHDPLYRMVRRKVMHATQRSGRPGIFGMVIVGLCLAACAQRVEVGAEAAEDVLLGGMLPGWYEVRGFQDAAGGWSSLRLAGDGSFELGRAVDLSVVTDLGRWRVQDGLLLLTGEARRQELPPPLGSMSGDAAPMRDLVVETSSQFTKSYRPVVQDGWVYLVDPDRDAKPLDGETMVWCFSRELDAATGSAARSVDGQR